jgi:hypothetical protein
MEKPLKFNPEKKFCLRKKILILDHLYHNESTGFTPFVVHGGMDSFLAT